MGAPIVIVDSGGIPVTRSLNGSPVEIADNGFGTTVTVVESGGLPVTGIFKPTDLNAALWLEPAQGGLFQSIAGTTAASANSDVVGYLPDLSGNAKHYTAEADNTTRPALQGVGTHPAIRFDGSNDLLQRTESLGLLAAGAYTIAIALKSNSPSVDARLFDEGNSASNNTLFIPIQAANPTATSSNALYRNDAGTQLVNPSSVTNANVFNNTDKVVVVTDDGVNIRTYVNGVTGAATTWTPSGVFTLNRSAIGGLLRASTGNWFPFDFYGMVAVKRVITPYERTDLTKYMGRLAGLSL